MTGITAASNRAENTDGKGTAWRSVVPGFLRWFSLFACVIGVVNGLMIESELLHQRRIREADARNRTLLAAKYIELSFRTIIADLKFLAESATVRRFSARLPGAMEQLSGDLLDFSRHKRWYDQVRYLDLSGMERVRVDYRGGKPHVVERDALQDKSARYYFADSARLSRGEVFVSPLDLNIEHGKIEQPLKPMLRFGTPVFGPEGKKRGILLLNFLAAELLANFQATLPEADGELYLLNADGYWLSSPDPADQWGFMYPERRERTFARRYPGVWAKMQRSAAGNLSDPATQFVYSTLHPLAARADVNRGTPATDRDGATGYRWFVVSRYRLPGMLEIATRPWPLTHLSLTLLLAAIGAWFVARSLRQDHMIMEDRMHHATRQAQETIRTLSQAVEQSPVSIVITDPEARIEYVNQGFETATGYAAAEVIGKNPNILKSGDASPRVYEELWRTVKQGGTWRGELHNRRKDGSLFWERANISPVLDDDGTIRHFLAVKEDISLQRTQEDKILHQAHYDFLTDLPNRFLAIDRLEQLIKTADRLRQQAGVLFLDMDDFKKVNDTLGHEIGDQLLIQASQRLNGAIRAQDTVARLGGDEFLVILGALNEPKAAGTVAEHLLESFMDPFLLGGHELVVTLSIGIALYPQDGARASELLRNADVAMYQAKQAGRNTYRYFATSMNRDVVRRLTLEARLRGALQRRELVLHYQPIVDLDSRTPVGAEALLRWHDAELGDVSPAEFIPVAEQTGLIKVIGIYVLSEAARQAVKFRERFGSGFYISVNASPPQFNDAEFSTYVEAALQETGLSGDALVLEITEGVLLKGDPKVDTILARLHELHVHLSMDDFGTGYSSLNYLRRYPFDVLKIDRLFVRDIATDSNDRELVRATLQMAHALDLKVVAEGVEEENQRELLLGWGCDLGQGFLFGRPVDADRFCRERIGM